MTKRPLVHKHQTWTDQLPNEARYEFSDPAQNDSPGGLLTLVRAERRDGTSALVVNLWRLDDSVVVYAPIRNQVGALPVNYADLKQQVDALSDLIQSDKMAPVLTSGDMDVLEPIMDLLDSILENMGGSGNALLFDHD